MAGKYKSDEVFKLFQDSGYALSDADRRLTEGNADAGMSLFTAKDQWAKAKTAEEKAAANAAAELIRRREGGYTGGKDGSGYMLDYTYAPKQGSPYTDLMESAVSGVLERDPFSYNAASDPSYQAYSEKYRNLGRNAMQNTLGSAAAMTGGLPSSYAMTAAQQANDTYNAQMSDVIPTLEQAAYQKYVNEISQSRNDVSMLAGLDEAWYGRELSKYDRDHTADREIVSDKRYEDETKYSREQDALEWNYRNNTQAFEQAMNKWAATGKLDAAGAKVLGLPAGATYADYQYMLAQIRALDRG